MVQVVIDKADPEHNNNDKIIVNMPAIGASIVKVTFDSSDPEEKTPKSSKKKRRNKRPTSEERLKHIKLDCTVVHVMY